MLEASSTSTTTRNRLLLALAFAAGYVDALSYLGLNRVLTANMTGNTVLLALSFAQLDGGAELRSSLALAGFLGGAAAGAWTVERNGPDVWPRAVTRALTLELFVLVMFAAGGTCTWAAPTAALIVLQRLRWVSRAQRFIVWKCRVSPPPTSPAHSRT